MIRDGIYEMISTGASYASRGVFVGRNGAFTGMGQAGAIYEGVYHHDKARGCMVFEGCVRFRPDTELVTGPKAGSEGLTLPFSGTFAPATPESNFTMKLDGQPIEILLRFVAPLPE